MQRTQTIHIYSFEFEIGDLKNAGIITLACAIAALYSSWWPFAQSIWAIAVIPFFLYAKIGATSKARTLSLIPMGLVTALYVGLTSLLNVGPWLMLPWFFITTFMLYLLPRFCPNTSLAGIFILIFGLLAYSMPTNSWESILERMMAIVGGTALMVCTNFLFDHATHRELNATPDNSLFLLQRAFRMAINMAILIFICDYWQIKNPAWVAFSLIAVEQNNLGTSLKKATQRIAGTIFGIAAGFLLNYFAFDPYPASRVLALCLVFGLFASLRYNYTFAIFLGTILLADLFHYLSNASTTLSHFLFDRVNDTLLGITIGIMGALIIFPRSLLGSLKENVYNFWLSALAVLQTAELKKLENENISHLYDLIHVAEQDIKDFRYEPVSFLFRRYHFCIKLMALMKKLTADLKKLPDISCQLSDDMFKNIFIKIVKESIEVIVFQYSTHKPIVSARPFFEIDQKVMIAMESLKDYPEAKEVLVAIHLILQLYQKIAKTPRWYLEVT